MRDKLERMLETRERDGLEASRRDEERKLFGPKMRSTVQTLPPFCLHEIPLDFGLFASCEKYQTFSWVCVTV